MTDQEFRERCDRLSERLFPAAQYPWQDVSVDVELVREMLARLECDQPYIAEERT